MVAPQLQKTDPYTIVNTRMILVILHHSGIREVMHRITVRTTLKIQQTEVYLGIRII